MCGRAGTGETEKEGGQEEEHGGSGPLYSTITLYISSSLCPYRTVPTARTAVILTQGDGDSLLPSLFLKLIYIYTGQRQRWAQKC
jgi:hypothetical protein